MKALLVGLLALAALSGCEKALDEPGETEERPTLTFEGFQAFGTRGQEREWQAWAEEAEVYTKANLANARGVRIHYYDGDTVISVLKADRARIDTKAQDVEARGNVILKGENGVVLTTTELFWDHGRQRIHTPARVKVVREDNVLTGRGLVSDRNLGSVEVLHDVKITARSVESLRGLGRELDGAP